jgi:L-threonylcarbamoyladenylate synthase
VKDILKEAVRVIKNGGIVAIPTDTVYGLAVDPYNKTAIKRLYTIKGRSEKKPVALLISSLSQVNKFALNVPKKAKDLIKKNWPGALTLIFNKKGTVPAYLNSSLPTIGIRMPNHKKALAIIKACGGALAVTSANRSGEDPAVTPEQLKKMVGIDLIIEDGESGLGIASSVVAVSGDEITILRQGPELKL